MRIVSAFLLLAVLAGLALFLTFTSSWGAVIAPQAREGAAAATAEASTPTPDLTGKIVAEVDQPVIVRTEPAASAQIVKVLSRGQMVALAGCDTDVLWCQMEDGGWILAYMLSDLPDDLPVLGGHGLTVKQVLAGSTPTEAAFAPPTATAVPAAPLKLSLPTPTPAPVTYEGSVSENANLREGPGTDFGLVGSAPAGTTLMLAGKSEDGEWYQLLDGSWVAAFLVETSSADQLPVVKSTDTDATGGGTLIDALTEAQQSNAQAAPEASAGEQEAGPEVQAPIETPAEAEPEATVTSS